MKKNLTDITVILDRSQSMESCAEEAVGGLNSFIDAQREAEGDAVLTLIKFDHEYNVVCEAVDIKHVGYCGLDPRGTTALLDAIGKTIVTTGDRLKRLDENERPGLVIICILTDGLENCSMDFTRDQIKKMIEIQTEEYSWQFTFLGANQDAFRQGGAMGFKADTILNYNTDNTKQVFGSMSKNVKRMRVQAAGGQSVSCSYTAKEREEAVE